MSGQKHRHIQFPVAPGKFGKTSRSCPYSIPQQWERPVCLKAGSWEQGHKVSCDGNHTEQGQWPEARQGQVELGSSQEPPQTRCQSPTALCCENPSTPWAPPQEKGRRGGTLTWLDLNLKWWRNCWIAWVYLKETKTEGFDQRWKGIIEKWGKFHLFSLKCVACEMCSLPLRWLTSESWPKGRSLTSVSGPWTKGREITVSEHRLRSLQRRKWAPETSLMKQHFLSWHLCEANSVIPILQMRKQDESGWMTSPQLPGWWG